MAPNIVIVAPEQFLATASTTIAELIGESITIRGTCSLALCGGSTPEPVYRELTHRSINWANLSIYFGDERAVSPDSAESNFAMATRALFDHVAIPGNQIHRMLAERPDRDVAAREYDALLPPRIDLLLLGVGPDGHTASIFPESPAITEPWRRVVSVGAPAPPLLPNVARMTITPLVVAAARHIVVMVRSADKAAIVQRVLEGPDQPETLPAQFARGGTWILDQAAAAQLHSRDT